MTAIADFLQHPVVVATGWGLFHLLWQGALIAAITAVLLRLMRESSANARYLVSCAALVAMVLMAVLTAVRLYEPGAPAAAPLLGSPLEVTKEAAQVLLSAPDSATPFLSWPALSSLLFRPLIPWIFAGWLFGVIALTLRLAAGWLAVQRLCRSAESAGAEIVERARVLARRMNLERPIRILATSRVEVPIVVGWLRPVLLFPFSALSGLDAQQLETIVAHELAHIRRHDYLVNILQTIVETLFFYHPAVWWISSRIRAERENCCDDIVVETCGNPLLYARALTSLEEMRSVAGAHALAATGGSLRERVVRLVCASHRSASSHRIVTGLSVAIITFSLVLATPLSLLARSRELAPAAKESGETITVTAPVEAVEPTVEKIEAPLAPVVRFAEEVVADLLFDAPEAPQAPDAPHAVHAPDAPHVPVPAAHPAPMAPPAPHPHPAPAGRAAPVAFAMAVADADFDFDFDFDSDVDTDVDVDVDVDDDRQPDTTPASGNLTVDDLIALRSAGVTAAYIESIRAAGYPDVTTRELKALSIFTVTPAFIREMNAVGWGKLTPRQLATAKNFQLDAGRLTTLRKDFGDLTFRDALNLQIHGVTADYAAEMRRLFGNGLSIRDLAEMKIHGVSEGYVRSMAEVGYRNLSAKDVRSLKVMGVTPDYVRSLRKAGLDDLTARELVRLKATGVDSDYVQELSKYRKKASK